MMRIPDEFRDLGASFYAGSDIGLTPEQWIVARISILSAHETKRSLEFLNELLDGKPDSRRLQEAWKNAGSNYCFHEPDLVVFLKMLRDALEQQLQQ